MHRSQLMNFSSLEIWLWLKPRILSFETFELGFEAKGEASLDQLHGFLERNIRSRRDQSVKVIGMIMNERRRNFPWVR